MCSYERDVNAERSVRACINHESTFDSVMTLRCNLGANERLPVDEFDGKDVPGPRVFIAGWGMQFYRSGPVINFDYKLLNKVVSDDSAYAATHGRSKGAERER